MFELNLKYILIAHIFTQHLLKCRINAFTEELDKLNSWKEEAIIIVYSTNAAQLWTGCGMVLPGDNWIVNLSASSIETSVSLDLKKINKFTFDTAQKYESNLVTYQFKKGGIISLSNTSQCCFWGMVGKSTVRLASQWVGVVGRENARLHSCTLEDSQMTDLAVEPARLLNSAAKLRC